MDLISLEADSTLIESFDQSMVPGLLQTPAYARNVIEIGPFADDLRRVEKLVKIRMKRQNILTGPEPSKIWAILDEAALRRMVGDEEVMRAQLQHLLDMANLPNVILQVLSFSAGAHRGMTGAFKILYFGRYGGLPVVVVDSLTQMNYREEDHEIRRYVEAFNHLRASALSEESSNSLIERLMSAI
jgi:hypothetical protein